MCLETLFPMILNFSLLLFYSIYSQFLKAYILRLYSQAIFSGYVLRLYSQAGIVISAVFLAWMRCVIFAVIRALCPCVCVLSISQGKKGKKSRTKSDEEGGSSKPDASESADDAAAKPKKKLKKLKLEMSHDQYFEDGREVSSTHNTVSI